MDSLQYQLDVGRYRWKQRVQGEPSLGSKWEDISWVLFSDGASGSLSFRNFILQNNAFDALSMLISLDTSNVADFVKGAPGYGLEIASMTLVELASQSPVGHFLQQLLVAGSLDRFLIRF